MKVSRIAALLATLTLTAACNKKAATHPNYDNAINAYYVAHPVCLWTSEKQFPVQSAPDDAKTAGYDALVDAGLLTRTTSEKKIIIISKRENNYDLSADGRAAWTADPNQPGYGNFCFGHRTVSSIDSATPNDGTVGSTSTVNYHYAIAGQPGWATAQETQTAFPQVEVGSDTSRPATATLTDTANGWQVTSAPGSSSSTPAKPADDKIVQ
jgi:hypothetical protein